MGWLTAIQDRLDDVRRKIVEPQDLPDITVGKTFRIGKRLDRLKRTALHLLSPVMGERNRFDQRLASLIGAMLFNDPNAVPSGSEICRDANKAAIAVPIIQPKFDFNGMKKILSMNRKSFASLAPGGAILTPFRASMISHSIRGAFTR
jgi:hypothetical protein